MSAHARLELVRLAELTPSVTRKHAGREHSRSTAQPSQRNHAHMRSILLAKAKRHEYVCRKLMETGDRQIIEKSWRDDYWGWGPNRDGQNMLGRLWMEIRDELRAAPPSDGGAR